MPDETFNSQLRDVQLGEQIVRSPFRITRALSTTDEIMAKRRRRRRTQQRGIIVMTVSSVTDGANFTPGNTITGDGSGETAEAISFDGADKLTVRGASGVFTNTETLDDTDFGANNFTCTLDSVQ